MNIYYKDGGNLEDWTNTEWQLPQYNYWLAQKIAFEFFCQQEDRLN